MSLVPILVAFAMLQAAPPQGASPTAPPGPNLEDHGRSLDGGAAPGVYEMNMRSALNRAPGGGALDGAWTLSDANGVRLFTCQFIDAGDGRPVDGAWRDLFQSSQSARARGVFEEVRRAEGQIVLTLEGGGIIRLTPAGDGTYTGELARDGRKIAVVLAPG